jgi:hypothetical protein
MRHPDGLILGITIGVMLVSGLVFMYLLGADHIVSDVLSFLYD